MSKIVSTYIDIYSKVYIGYLAKNTFLRLIQDYDTSELNIPKIEENYIYITLEKLDDGRFEIIYYIRESNSKLKKVEIGSGELKISEKDPKGFTVAETKFIKHCLKESNELSIDNVENIKKTILSWSF